MASKKKTTKARGEGPDRQAVGPAAQGGPEARAAEGALPSQRGPELHRQRHREEPRLVPRRDGLRGRRQWEDNGKLLGAELKAGSRRVHDRPGRLEEGPGPREGRGLPALLPDRPGRRSAGGRHQGPRGRPGPGAARTRNGAGARSRSWIPTATRSRSPGRSRRRDEGASNRAPAGRRPPPVLILRHGRHRPLRLAGGRRGRARARLGEAAERADPPRARGAARVPADLRQDAGHPRLEGQDPDPRAAGHDRLQLLEGRQARARRLAAHHARQLSDRDPRLGDRHRRRRPGQGREHAVGLQGRGLPAARLPPLPRLALPRRRRRQGRSASSTP